MRPPLSRLPLLPVAAGLVLLIILCRQWIIPSPLEEDWYAQPLEFSGVISSCVDRESTVAWIVKVDSVEKRPISSFKINVSLMGTPFEDLENFRVKFRGMLEPIEEYSVTHPYYSSIATYMRNSGIVARVLIKPGDISELTPEKSLFASVRSLNADLKQVIASAGFDSSTSAFIIAILTGDDSLLALDNRDAFTRAGVAHVLALSGLHVGIIMMIANWAVLPFYLLGWHKIRGIMIISVLWFYVFLTGLSPSVVRAVIMATVVIIGIMTSGRRCALNSLLLAAIVILICQPLMLWNIGFQMSFLSVAGLLLIVPVVNRVNHRQHPKLFTLVSFAVSMIAAFIATAPLVVYYFHVLPLAFIPANILTFILLPVILMSAILTLVLMYIGLPHMWLAVLVSKLHGWLNSWVTRIAEVPDVAFDGIDVSWEGMIMIYFSLSLIVWTLNRPRIVGFVASSMSIVGVGLILLIPTQSVTEGFWILPDKQYATVAILSNDTLTMLSFAPPALRKEIEMIGQEKTKEYRIHNHIAGYRAIDPQSTKSRNFASSTLCVNGLRYKFHSSVDEICSDTTSADYLVVCNGFRGNIIDLWENSRSDTLILTNSVGKQRNKRYRKELTEANVPHLVQ